MTVHYIDVVNGEDKTWTHSITGATRADPCVLTLGAHPFQAGDVVYITGVVGMTQLNTNTYTVTAIGATTISLNVNSTAFGIYTSGGTLTLYRRVISGVTQANPAVVTCYSHGFTNGQQVYIVGVGGMTQLNNNVYTVANATTDTFELSGIDSTGYGAYTTGGKVARPYLTFAFAFGNTANRVATSDELRVAKTTAATTHMLGNCTWVVGSNIVSTSVSYAATINVGDLVGIPTAAGNGADESYYRVTGRSGTQITLAGYYAGPATVTVGGIKVQPAGAATGPNPGYACNITVGCTVSGGWELSATPSQNGETWITTPGARAVSTNIGIGLSATGITLDRMNVEDTYYALAGAGASPVITNCTFTNANYYTVYSLASGYSMSQVRVGHNDGPSWSVFYPASANNSVTNVVVGSYAATSGIAVQCSAVTHNFAGVTVRGAGRGFATVSDTVLNGGTVHRCMNGVQIGGQVASNTLLDLNIDYCTYGIQSTSQSQGLLVRDCDIDQCTYAISLGQTHGARIEGCQFSNSTNYDIEVDIYSGFVYSVNNSHITPGIRAYNRASSSGPIYIINCTIDAGSVAKTFAQTANNNAIMPQFYLQDSFFGLTGQYYGRFEVVKNTGTVPPSVQLKFNTTVQNYYADQKVASTYTRQGVGKTLSFKLTSMSSGWAGSLVPKVKLNGITIQTEPTITSVSFGSDDSYSFVIPGGSITQDGELSIEFTANANTVAILVKEFTVS